jgi:cysteinyl-tRNA synthetase
MSSPEVTSRDVKLYDTRSGQKHALEPIEPGHIGMYVCGVTVYDLTHIGHARVYTVFDVVERFLEYLGYEVTHVRNFTDVDDKIIDRANERGEDPLELSQRYIEEFNRDMAALNVRSADHEPKVSEVVDDVIEMVERLEDNGYAYEVDGDVYYRVEKFDGYGKLSHRNLEDMEAGRSGRTEEASDDKKEHPFDFALWKKSDDDEPSWESPWGEGRPGWHIECSVMSTKFLGEHFDIHGGGSDLIFPHHENEIAQSEGASGHEPLVHHWMHIGMVNVAEENEDGEVVEQKMSKSLGNFWTTRDVLDAFHPDAVRYFLLTAHYRKPITYSMDNLEEATQRIEYLYTTLRRIDDALTQAGYDEGERVPKAEFEPGTEATVSGFLPEFESALADNINTPEALAAVSKLASLANELTETEAEPGHQRAYTLYVIAGHLRKAGDVLGILQKEPREALGEIRDLKLEDVELSVEEIDRLVEQREKARANEEWETADDIRDRLEDAGIEVMDSGDETDWRAK